MKLTALDAATVQQSHARALGLRPDQAMATAAAYWLSCKQHDGDHVRNTRHALATVKWHGRIVKRVRWNVPEDNTEH
jgi:hypothetical protein